jgi:hypothetical protein
MAAQFGECLGSRDTSYPSESRQHPSNVIDSKEEGRGERDDGRLGQLEREVDSHLECLYGYIAIAGPC